MAMYTKVEPMASVELRVESMASVELKIESMASMELKNSWYFIIYKYEAEQNICIVFENFKQTMYLSNLLSNNKVIIYAQVCISI